MVCHIDGVLAWGESREQHNGRLRAVLERLQQGGVTRNEEKCVFGADSVQYLGHIVSGTGITPEENKLAAVREMKRPKSKTELRRMLGMANYLA